ncbi:MAG: septum formation initiator family protein [Microbacteriaceae bacterium]|nr:MAG: septum formation initiator family protein [Microbacteriaceae bacterium]
MAGEGSTGGWLRGIRFSWFTFLMMGILVLGVLVVAPTLQQYIQQRQQIADMQHANATLRSKVKTLDADKARWSDPSYIRAEARDRLLYVMPGETSYLVIDDRPAAAKKDTAPVSKSIQKTQSDWLGALFDSIMIAGLSTQPVGSLPTSNPAG